MLINSAGTVTCGANRLLFRLDGPDLRPIGSPTRSASVVFFSLGTDPSTPVAQSATTFVWVIEDVAGIYVADVSLPEAGRYGFELTTAEGAADPEVVRVTFDVQPDSPITRPGDTAPAAKTPTLNDVDGDVARISTDPSAEPALYGISLDQALKDHKPVVVVFATPKFCVSAQCGPTLGRVKPYIARYPTVTFINIEPYELRWENGSLEPVLDAQGRLKAVPIVDAWGIVVEPTVYVVNRDGIVTANFDLIFTDAELTAALDAVK